MRRMTLAEVAEAVNGRLLGDADAAHVGIDAVQTDTRALAAASAAHDVLFVALRGERFDAHDYLPQAAAAGARAALVSRAVESPEVLLPQVLVEDTERALAALAAHLQRARATRTLAVTGSNGKTSVKSLLHAILDAAAHAQGGVAYVNPGNRNNEIGLPLAVIDAPEDALYAVYEMGAGKPGDIAYLCDIAPPVSSLVNNVGAAHLERLGSLYGVADTKAAIYDALPADGTAAINVDDAFATYFEARIRDGGAQRRLIRFGLDHDAEVTAQDIALDADGARFLLRTPEGEATVHTAMPGRHNVLNALAAASLAMGVGIGLAHIVAGLQAARPVGGRLVSHRLAGGVTLIDDSYNANPSSLDAAIDTLAATPGARWLVIGDMRELGADGAALHAGCGRRAKASGIDRLYALGELSAAAVDAFGEGARHFADHAALADALAADLHAHRAAGRAAPAAMHDTGPGLRVLVKGSRGSAMDRIVQALLAREGDAGDTQRGDHHAA